MADKRVAELSFEFGRKLIQQILCPKEVDSPIYNVLAQQGVMKKPSCVQGLSVFLVKCQTCTTQAIYLFY